MRSVQTLTEHVSFTSASTLFTIAYMLLLLFARFHEHIRVKRLGSYAPCIKTRVPFGLDFLAASIKATLTRQNYTYWRDTFFQNATLWTTEVRVLNERVIFTADPENIRALLATQFGDFGKGDQFRDAWGDFLGDSIFTQDGPRWHDSRQLIRHYFASNRISDLSRFESHVDTLLQVIEHGGPLDSLGPSAHVHRVGGEGVDMRDAFFRYTLDVTTSVLLGNDAESLRHQSQEFADAFDETQRLQNALVRATKLRPYIPKGYFWFNLRIVDDFVNRYVDRALQVCQADPGRVADKADQDGERFSFLDALASRTKDRKVLRDQIVSVLLAGRDTTASTLSWAMYELGRRPEVVRRLRAEILETLPAGGQPTYAQLKSMSCLEAIINETLRLYPAVPFNVRVALRDTALPRGGSEYGDEPLGVPAGTRVAYSTLVMQRRRDLCPDADKFRPERWEHWRPKPHEFIPFNSGPRLCIGQQFAQVQMAYVLCRIFQRYETATSASGAEDTEDPVLRADIVLSPGQEVRVLFGKGE
ncbi:cytochrome P450 [Ilyonectria destructans]|nr:cytochrome P450 [Ilyonectria destructans]